MSVTRSARDLMNGTHSMVTDKLRDWMNGSLPNAGSSATAIDSIRNPPSSRARWIRPRFTVRPSARPNSCSISGLNRFTSTSKTTATRAATKTASTMPAHLSQPNFLPELSAINTSRSALGAPAAARGCVFQYIR